MILKNLTTTAVLTRVGKTWIDYGDDGHWTWTEDTGADRSRRGRGDQSFAIAAREWKRALTDVTSCCCYAITTVVTRGERARHQQSMLETLVTGRLPWIRNAIVTDFTAWTVVTGCTRANVG